MKNVAPGAQMLALTALCAACARPPAAPPGAALVVPPRTTPLTEAMVRPVCTHDLELPVQLGCSWIVRLPSGLSVKSVSEDTWRARLEDECTSPIVDVSIRRAHAKRHHATRRYLEQAQLELERAHGPLMPAPPPKTTMPMLWLRTPSQHDSTTLLVSATRQRDQVLVVTYQLDQEPDEAFAAFLETSASSPLRLPGSEAAPAGGGCRHPPSEGPRMNVSALAVVTWAAATSAAMLIGATLERVGLL